MRSAYTIPIQRIQPQPISSVTWLFAGGLFLTVLFTMVVILFVFGVVIVRASDRVPPGVSVLGVSLGGLSVEEAAAELSAAWTAIQVRDGSRTWTVSADSLGLKLDSHATAQNMQAKGWVLLLGQSQSALIVTVDPAQAEKGLKALAAIVVSSSDKCHLPVQQWQSCPDCSNAGAPTERHGHARSASRQCLRQFSRRHA